MALEETRIHGICLKVDEYTGEIAGTIECDKLTTALKYLRNKRGFVDFKTKKAPSNEKGITHNAFVDNSYVKPVQTEA